AKADARTLQGLGIADPQSIESIVPTYLYRFRKVGQYQTQRLGESASR
ncbi:MAG: complex I NDUFA9 subunit family protein, partial [Methylocystis sp.]